MAQSAISRNPNPALDLLRVLAAAMVLLVHAGQAAGLDSVTWVGGNGVLLFFILSGHLTMASLDRQFKPGAYYGRPGAANFAAVLAGAGGAVCL